VKLKILDFCILTNAPCDFPSLNLIKQSIDFFGLILAESVILEVDIVFDLILLESDDLHTWRSD
jgi:hypothetical protein